MNSIRVYKRTKMENGGSPTFGCDAVGGIVEGHPFDVCCDLVSVGLATETLRNMLQVGLTGML
jgi:hypothetical protein